jgi:hypothetical protein
MSRHIGDQFETEVAKLLAAKKTANSGAMFNDGDLQTDHFVIECKFTTKDSKTISVKQDYIDHVSKQAEMLSKEWAVVLGSPHHSGYALVTLDTLSYLLDLIPHSNKK